VILRCFCVTPTTANLESKDKTLNSDELLILLMTFLLPAHFGRPPALRRPTDKIVDRTVMCKIIVIPCIYIDGVISCLLSILAKQPYLWVKEFRYMTPCRRHVHLSFKLHGTMYQKSVMFFIFISLSTPDQTLILHCLVCR